MDVLGLGGRLAALGVAVGTLGAAWRLVAGVLGEPAGLATAALVAAAVVVAAAAGTRSLSLATPYW